MLAECQDGPPPLTTNFDLIGMTVAELLLGPKPPSVFDILLVLLTLISLHVLSKLISTAIKQYWLRKPFTPKNTFAGAPYVQRPPRAEELVPGAAPGAPGL